jgi:cytochrome P450
MEETEQLIAKLYDDALNRGDNGFVSDYDSIQVILKSHESFTKDYGLVDILFKSRFNTDGEEWVSRKFISHKYFKHASSPHFDDFLKRQAKKYFSGSDLIRSDDLQERLSRYAVENVIKLLFDREVVPEGLVDWLFQTRSILRRLQIDTLKNVCDFGYARAQRANLMERLGAILQSADLRLESNDVFLTTDSKDPLIEEVAMLLVGGVESTLSTLLWSLDVLGRSAEFQEFVRNEECASAELYIGVFINEIMRRFPPIPMLVRRTADDVELGAKAYAAGTLIKISIVGAHHDARIWPDPFTFKYRRAEFLNKTFDRRAYFPFSQGARVCAGQRFATQEIKCALLEILSNYNIYQPVDLFEYVYNLTLSSQSYKSLVFSRLN